MFHDVMKTCRWEIRSLSFFLAVAEANAFSAYSFFRRDDEEVPMHFEFRWRLAQSMLEHVESLKQGEGQPPERILRPRGRWEGHKFMPLGKSSQGKYLRRRCVGCHVRTQHTC